MAIIKNPFMVVGDKNPLIANNEDELNALLTSKNAGKAVLYSGELYIVEGGEATENPTAVQLYTTPAGVPMTASTEEEANALLVENNVGRIFKYTGEGGASNALIAVGDTITAFYFDTSWNADTVLAMLDWDNPDDTIEGMSVFYVVNANATPDLDGMLLSFVKMGEGSYAIAVAQSGMVYTTESGWDSESFDLSYLIGQGYNTTVAYVGHPVAQATWNKFISKEPFTSGSASKYETNALYLISEGGSGSGGSGTPLAVGDTLSSVYFDISKDIDPSVFDLNIDNNYAVSLLFNENNSPALSFAMMTAENSPTGEDAYMLSFGEGEAFLWASFEYADMGIVKGWQQGIKDTNGKFDIGETAPINELRQPEGWATFASSTPFTASGGGGGVAAKKLQVAE